MWGVDAKEIESAVGKRIPVRYNRDDRYFTDTFQNLPKNGYHDMFSNILSHKLITIELCCEFDRSMTNKYDHSFLSLPIDKFFDCKFGELPYRSIKFEQITSKLSQPAVTVNFTDQDIYTRSTQWDLLPNSLKSNSGYSTQTLEIPCQPEDNNGECYYPIRNAESLALYEKYKNLSLKCKDLTFCGRSGLFKYIDMVPAVNIHLKMAKDFLEFCS